MTKRLGTQLAGVAFLLVLCLLVWVAVAIYDKAFTPAEIVTLQTDRVGSQLENEADIKVKGVPFGTVRSVRSSGNGARITLAINPSMIDQLPSNVSARLLPKSVFGERYVDLQLPQHPVGTLKAGDVIPQDRSSRAIEVEQVLDNLMPLLRAVQPQKLNSSLGAISGALDNRGKPLGDSIVKLNDLLEKLNPLMPQFKADINGVADVANLYTNAAPDILQALSDLSATAKTIVDQQQQLSALFATVTSTSNDLNAFLRKNKDNIIGVSVRSRTTLQLLARYSPEFPCLFDAVNRMKPLMDKVLGAGTDEPGMHAEITVRPPRTKYLPGKDDPKFTAGGGPRCYAPGSDPGPAAASMSLGAGDLGLANSAYDRKIVSETVALKLNTTPADVPDWSSVLVGPLLRGTEVSLS